MALELRMEYEYMLVCTVTLLACLASWAQLWQSQHGNTVLRDKEVNFASMSPDMPGTEDES